MGEYAAREWSFNPAFREWASEKLMTLRRAFPDIPQPPACFFHPIPPNTSLGKLLIEGYLHQESRPQWMVIRETIPGR